MLSAARPRLRAAVHPEYERSVRIETRFPCGRSLQETSSFVDDTLRFRTIGLSRSLRDISQRMGRYWLGDESGFAAAVRPEEC